MTSPAATQSRLGYIAPFFIVRDLMASVDFYRDRLGFELSFLGPDDDPYFAIVVRDSISLMLKAVESAVRPTPNSSRDLSARWDAYIHTPDPEALAAEFRSRGVSFRQPLGINSDQLQGFEIADADGYVICFGRPI